MNTGTKKSILLNRLSEVRTFQANLKLAVCSQYITINCSLNSESHMNNMERLIVNRNVHV